MSMSLIADRLAPAPSCDGGASAGWRTAVAPLPFSSGCSAVTRALGIPPDCSESSNCSLAGEFPTIEAVLDSMIIAIDTPQGPAKAHVDAVAEPVGALVLGHGAG